MNRIKIAILISICLIVVVVSLVLWANYKGRKPVDDEQLPKIAIEGADSAIEKVRFVEEKEGRKTWELEAKSMHHYQENNFMVLEDVKLTFFTEDGRTVILTGKQGEVHQDTKDMELRGNVVATSSDGYRFRTQSVAYHHQDKKIQTSDPVEFDGEQVWLKGRGMLVDVEARTMKILHEVKTQWKAVKKG
jgi:LPS export ABC transporter protein LptC